MMKDKVKHKRIPKRHFVQLITAVLNNCNFMGFAAGKIYKGNMKGVCVPGLNCYSCPGAIASCPLGSLQSGLLSSRYRFPYYILGTLILFGLLLGRFICGFLFSWKVYFLVLLLVLCIFCYRAFCRFLCPLGALYSLFNPVSFFGIKVDPEKCTHCNACVRMCEMDVKKVCDRECIQCGKCRHICPEGAIHFGIHNKTKKKKEISEVEK